MRRLIPVRFLVAAVLAVPAAAQPALVPARPASDAPAFAARPPDAEDSSSLPASDEFEGEGDLRGWRWLHEVDGWPSHVRRSGLGIGAAGAFRLEPATSGWFEDFRAPFLYQDVEGDFFVRARIRAAGRAGGVPSVPWSLAGLMVRAPRSVTPATWTPRGENWLFLTTGAAAEGGVPVFETKTTTNSRSRLRLHPARAGWVELGVARVGPSFVLLSRYDGEPWHVIERFHRPDLPATLQVGLNAYTDWDSAADLRADPLRFNTTVLAGGRPDLVLDVDHVRFTRPTITGDVRALTQADVANDEVLRRLGLEDASAAEAPGSAPVPSGARSSSATGPVPAAASPGPLTRAVRAAVLDSVAGLLGRRYTDVAQGQRLADSLRAWAGRDAFAEAAAPAAFADVLGAAMRAVVADRHLYLVPAGPGAGGSRRGTPTDSAASARARFGIGRPERLGGGVAVLRLTSLAPLAWSRPALDSALAALRGARAVVLDLRAAPGGSPETVGYLLSHFARRSRTLLHAAANRADSVSDSVWTDPALGARGLGGTPLYVLTSPRTASAAELLAYAAQRTGLGTVVGETTAGAGNGGRMYPVGGGLRLFVPEWRTLTGPGWEGTGVAPDLAAPADRALKRVLALERGS